LLSRRRAEDEVRRREQIEEGFEDGNDEWMILM
jgi:hypothetical protein